MRILVLDSSWKWAKLWWVDGRWESQVDRQHEWLDDAQVRCRFGSEAFRRRDLVLAGGAKPISAGVSIIGQAVIESLRNARWVVSRDEHHEFEVRRDDDLCRVSIVAADLQVKLHVSGVSVEGATRDLGALETAIIAGCVHDDVSAALDIVVAPIVLGEENDERA